jgi:hypothetical protein
MFNSILKDMKTFDLSGKTNLELAEIYARSYANYLFRMAGYVYMSAKNCDAMVEKMEKQEMVYFDRNDNHRAICIKKIHELINL